MGSRHVAVLALVTGASALLVAGCSSSGRRAPPEKAPLRVETGGLVLGGNREDALAPEAVVAKVDELLRAGRRRSAELLVRRFPDAVLLALLEPRAATRPVVHWIARVHEAQCASGDPQGGFQALLADWGEHRDKYEEYSRARAAVQQDVREGAFEEAGERSLPVPEGPGTEVLRLESLRLRGTACLLAGRTGEAATAFRQASDVARVTRAYEHAGVLLLLAEAEQRSEHADEAARAWTEAVVRAVSDPAAPLPFFDPGFWVRAVGLRGNAPWPSSVARALALQVARDLPAATRSSGSPVEHDVWRLVGLARLERDELRPALAAFGRAEALAGDEVARACVRLEQGRTLARLGEPLAAQSLLAALAARRDDAVTREALGLLGSIELKLGRVERGLPLLRKAAGAQPGDGPPDAAANLGLGLLASGNEAEGLRWLHAGRASYEAGQRLEGVVQCLRNELRYVERLGRTAEAEELRRELLAWEQRDR